METACVGENCYKVSCIAFVRILTDIEMYLCGAGTLWHDIHATFS
jgi:hypothetical protein